jgi:hypothetical protein
MIKQRIYLILCVVLLLTAAFGCVGIVKLKPEERHAHAALIQALSTKWESYTIYSAIWPGSQVVALLFDSRSDDGAILAEEWTKVDTSADLAYLLARLQAGGAPRLFQVLGPDGHSFGYLYAIAPILQTQVVDGRTVRVFPIKPPPAPGP